MASQLRMAGDLKLCRSVAKSETCGSLPFVHSAAKVGSSALRVDQVGAGLVYRRNVRFLLATGAPVRTQRMAGVRPKRPGTLAADSRPSRWGATHHRPAKEAARHPHHSVHVSSY